MIKTLKKYRYLFLLLICLTFFNSCGKTSDNSGSNQIVYAVDYRMESLDPTRVQNPYTIQILGLVYEGLVTLDGTEQVVPALAKSWESNDDFTTWTFHIREGVYFQDNKSIFSDKKTREITAEDVRYSFEKLVSKDSYPSFVIADAVQGVAEYQNGKLDSVSGFEALDKYTFKVHLVKSEPSFVNRITSPWYSIFPKEAFELGPDKFGNTIAIGTGPFQLEKRNDTNVELIRNSEYWKETDGNIEKVSIRTINSDQVRLSELRNNNINVMHVPDELAPAMINTKDNGKVELQSQYSEDFNLDAFSTFDSHFLGFNTNSIPPSLRKAISVGLNRQEIVDVITNGTARMATGTVPAGLLGYKPPYPNHLFNPDSARNILEEDNLAAGQTLNILSIDRDLGNLVQAQLKKIGINAEVDIMDYNAVLGKMIDGSADAYLINLIYVFSAPEVILNNIFNSSKIPAPNFFRYKSSKVDALLDSVRQVADREKTNEIAQKIEKLIIDDAPAVFLYQAQNLVVYDNKYQNLQANGHGVLNLWNVKVAD